MADTASRRYTRREFVQKGLAGAAAASVAAHVIGGFSRARGQGRSDTLVVGQSIGAMPSIDPYQQSTAPLHARWAEVYGTLFNTGAEDGRMRPQLAEEWEWRNNGMELHIKLRQGVRWHDGEKFTAKDVVFSFNRIRDGSILAKNLTDLERWEAKDDHYVVLYLHRPRVTLLNDLYVLAIQPAHGPERYGANWLNRPIGTGPYKFVAWRRGEYFRLQRNDEYWGEPPEFQYAVFRSIPESATRATALTSGEIDIADRLPPELVPLVERAPNCRIETVAGLRIMFIALNPIFEPFRDKRVRQAMNYAIDKDTIIEHVLDGMASRLDGPVGPHVFGYNPHLKPYEYDPEKAKGLLKEAGYPDGFEVDFYSYSGRYLKDREVCQAIAGQLEKVGVRCRLHLLEYGIFSSMFEDGVLPMYLQGRGSIQDADIYYDSYFRTGVTKRLSYSNPEVDRLILAQQRIFDPVQREAALQEVTALIHEEAPMIHLWNYLDIFGVRDHVQFRPRPDERILPSTAKRR